MGDRARIGLCDVDANGQCALPRGTHCRGRCPAGPGPAMDRRASGDDLHAQPASVDVAAEPHWCPAARRRAVQAPISASTRRPASLRRWWPVENAGHVRRSAGRQGLPASVAPLGRPLVGRHGAPGQLGEAQLGAHFEELVLQPRRLQRIDGADLVQDVVELLRDALPAGLARTARRPRRRWASRTARTGAGKTELRRGPSAPARRDVTGPRLPVGQADGNVDGGADHAAGGELARPRARARAARDRRARCRRRRRATVARTQPPGQPSSPPTTRSVRTPGAHVRGGRAHAAGRG